MSIPLNIDTPTGQPYTVNRTVEVDSTGRIRMHMGEARLQPVLKGEKVEFSFLDARRDIVIEITVHSLRKLAYELLGMAEGVA